MQKKYNIDVTKLSNEQYKYVIDELKNELKIITTENDKLQREVIDKKNYIKMLEQLEKYNDQQNKTD